MLSPTSVALRRLECREVAILIMIIPPTTVMTAYLSLCAKAAEKPLTLNCVLMKSSRKY